MVIDRRPTAPAFKSLQHSTEILTAMSSRLTGTEIDALKEAISDDFMEIQGWLREDNGRVTTTKGRSIYKPGYVTAIKKILDGCGG